MKKNWKLLTLTLAVLLLLSACGGSSASGAAYAEPQEMMAMDDYDLAEEAPMAAPEAAAYDNGVEMAYDGDMDYPAEAEEAVETEARDVEKDGGITDGATVNMSEKIIYSAYGEIETTEFDKSVEQVYKLMDQYGAFVESSSVTGSNISDSYYGSTSNRTADFTLRVPRDRYSAVTSALDQVGNVTYLSSSADNITSQYYDTQSRLDAYQVEEQRLLEILGQAETVEDMITVESRLSEIRYEKERLTSQLKNWDNQVSYSTVTLHIREVQVLTPEPPAREKTYWEQVGEGFMDTLSGMGEAAKTLFRILVAMIPVLALLAVVVIVILLLARRSRKKLLKKQAEKQAEKLRDQQARETDQKEEHTGE